MNGMMGMNLFSDICPSNQSQVMHTKQESDCVDLSLRQSSDTTEPMELSNINNENVDNDIPASPTANAARAEPHANISKPKAFAIWLSITCGVLCPFLDEGIIATAIPKITQDFHSLSDIGVRDITSGFLRPPSQSTSI